MLAITSHVILTKHLLATALCEQTFGRCTGADGQGSLTEIGLFVASIAAILRKAGCVELC